MVEKVEAARSLTAIWVSQARIDKLVALLEAIGKSGTEFAAGAAILAGLVRAGEKLLAEIPRVVSVADTLGIAAGDLGDTLASVLAGPRRTRVDH